MALAAQVHEHRLTVAFGDCDPAGIVYYPRLFDYFHRAMEEWFGVLGFDYSELILGAKRGFPCVHAEADFQAPCVLGETLGVELRVARLGSRSITFGYRVLGEQRAVRLTGKTVCVVMDLDESSSGYRQSTEMPADLRRAIEAFVAGEAG